MPMAAAPPPTRGAPETITASDTLSFEGSTEEVLRYTIVAKVRQPCTRSRQHRQR